MFSKSIFRVMLGQDWDNQILNILFKRKYPINRIHYIHYKNINTALNITYLI